MSYETLDDEGKEAVRAIIAATTSSLLETADMMEAGEIPMLTGPEALRDFAASIQTVLDMRDR